MKHWSEFLDPQFNMKSDSIRRRDRVVSICSNCEYRSVVIVNNLIQQVKKLGIHLCFSCSAKKGQIEGKIKRKNTMVQKYGTEVPQRIPQFKAKRKETFRKKKLENQQLRRALKIKDIIIKALLKSEKKV